MLDTIERNATCQPTKGDMQPTAKPRLLDQVRERIMTYIEQQVIRQTAARMGTPMHKPRRRNGGRCVLVRS